ncbi:MAG: 4'-phosphopantetheinyl transferase superfamily protein [Muribaculaceae bacterium]|nr:4'-phosphopantetheinyl transferase superfamily protein [Muribaculaceae bacterium]
MVYIDENIWDFDLQQALEQVSAQRREYALRYRHERDQRLCIAAYRLLMRAMKLEYGIDEAPEFIYDENGKPLLKGYPDIHFSLSHCHEAVACAVSDHPVGIDIETTEHYSIEVARRVMNDDEIRQIEASAQPEVTFTQLWTKKESLFKLTGDDLDGNTAQMLDKADNYRFETVIHPRYIYTVCSTTTPDKKH